MVKENEKPLYKPFPSKRAGKKFSDFGAKGMDDWRSGTATKEQRKSYRARASGIRDKNGNLTYKNKNTPNYWAYHYLW